MTLPGCATRFFTASTTGCPITLTSTATTPFRSGRYNTSGSAACHLLRRLAALFHDGHAQWLADKDEAVDLGEPPPHVPQAAYEGSAYEPTWQRYAHPQAVCLAWNVLWYNPDVAATPPDDLPTAHHFDNQGIALLRSGWGEEATVLSFSCGPLTGHRSVERVQAGEERIPSNFYHAHADYNAFTLFAQGNYFIVPPGYARRDSRFQNTLTVNGAHLRVDARCQPRLFAFAAGEAFRYVAGDASDAFAPHLDVSRFHRHLLMLPPDWIILLDDVRLLEAGWRAWNRLEWTVHSDPAQASLTIRDREARWRGLDGAGAEDGSELQMRVLLPDRFIWEQAHMSSTTGAGLLDPLRISVPEWYRPDLQVLSVWRTTPGELAAERKEATGCTALSCWRAGSRWRSGKLGGGVLRRSTRRARSAALRV